MVAKVYRTPDAEADAAKLAAPAPGDPDLEAEVAVVAAWFEALPSEWRRHLDDEARRGREAYAALATGESRPA